MSASLISLTWKEPIFQIRMVDKGLSNIQIAGLFSIETLAYTIASFLLNRIKE